MTAERFEHTFTPLKNLDTNIFLISALKEALNYLLLR